MNPQKDSLTHKKILSIREKDILIGKISNILKTKEEIIFAYIFGSFIAEDCFRDIDIGIFISDVDQVSTIIRKELELESDLEEIIHLPSDVRIINNAPISFVYNILKGGTVIVDNNRLIRSDFEGLIYKKYFDFQHLRREYLREILNAPI